MKSADVQDTVWMRYALGLARRGLGRVAPNPSVGCVLVRDNRLLGAARTADGGRPHAEAAALSRAGDTARGATAYVTLEPCVNRKTGPSCSELLAEAGVERVVIGCRDANPEINGRGIEALKQAGIKVTEGFMEDAARRLNTGFFLSRTAARPLIALKTATSLDGKIALSNGASQWITGPRSRRAGHILRAAHDAVLTGIGTVLADDPQMTPRLPGSRSHSTIRIVLDGSLRMTPDMKLFQDVARNPLWVVTDPGCAETPQARDLLHAGAEIIPHDTRDLPGLLKDLAGRGLTRILVEAGPRLQTGFFTAGLFDRLYWFRGSCVIGADGQDAFGRLGLESMDNVPFLPRTYVKKIDSDTLEIFERPG